jgi:hypothetical protein
MLDLELDMEAYDECLAALDRQFAELTGEAKRLMAQFVGLADERKQMLPVLITICEDPRYRSTSIRWSKTFPLRKEGSKRVLAKPIRKGRDTHKYPDSTFNFIEPELRAKVLHYEEMLSIIRYSLARNCIAHSHLTHTKKSLTKQLGASSDSVCLGSADEEALLS